MNLPDKAHLLPREVQAFLRLSRATIYCYLKDGIIPSVRVGGLYRIPREEFLKWCDNNLPQKFFTKETVDSHNTDFWSREICFKALRLKQRQIWSGVDFVSLKSPIVYIWFREKEVFYVGCSKKGIGRIFGYHSRLRHVAPDDSVMAWFFDSAKEAFKTEKTLIYHLRPKFNSMSEDDKAA